MLILISQTKEVRTWLLSIGRNALRLRAYRED